MQPERDDPFGGVVPIRDAQESKSELLSNASVTATPYTWVEPHEIPRRPWIYGRQLARGQTHGRFAPGAIGKTTLEIARALSLVTGRDFLGPKVWGGPKRVWLWNLEDPTEELARTIQATCKHYGISKADIGDRLYVDSAMDGAILKLATQTAMQGVTIIQPIADALIDEMLAREIDYLSIDPFISSHGVEENDNVGIDAVVKLLGRVATKTSAAIGLTHHVKKNGGGELNSEHARGASSLVAACRSALVLNRMSPDEAKGFGIPGEERRRFFRVYDDKNNRAPPANESDWFHLASVELGNGADGVPGDSIGVAEPWLPPDAFANVTSADLRRVQDIIHEKGDVRANHQAARWVGKLIAIVLSLNIEDGKDRRTINILISTWLRNGALIEVRRPDTKGDERPFIEVGEWVSGPGFAPPPPPRKGPVRNGADGAGIDRQPAPAPPIIRGAGVRQGSPDQWGGETHGQEDE